MRPLEVATASFTLAVNHDFPAICQSSIQILHFDPNLLEAGTGVKIRNFLLVKVPASEYEQAVRRSCEECAA